MNIPKGHQAVMPYLIVDGAAAFIDFLKNTFDAETTVQAKDDKGELRHCEAQINGSTIMFGNSSGTWKSRTADMFIYVDDADITYKKAIDAGATTVMELSNQDYGRTCGVKDPFENIWWITSIK
jgi:uncharacterized glyoxalase superfamily protein PhnB